MCSQLGRRLIIVQKLPLPVTKAKQQQTSLWPVCDHLAGFSYPLQSGPVSAHKNTSREQQQSFLKQNSRKKSNTRTLFPVPLPTGGWHSQAWRMAHSMISTRAVSWRSVKAKTSLSLSSYWKRTVRNGAGERPLTLFSWCRLIQQQADHRLPVLQQLWSTLPQAIHQISPMFMELENTRKAKCKKNKKQNKENTRAYNLNVTSGKIIMMTTELIWSDYLTLQIEENSSFDEAAIEALPAPPG